MEQCHDADGCKWATLLLSGKFSLTRFTGSEDSDDRIIEEAESTVCEAVRLLFRTESDCTLGIISMKSLVVG